MRPPSAGTSLEPDRGWPARAGDRGKWWQALRGHSAELAGVGILSLYLDQWVDMRLVFWNQYDLCLWHPAYVGEFFTAPGGPSIWLGKLILLLSCSGWPGAVVVAVLAGTTLWAACQLWSLVTPVTACHPLWIMTAVLLGVVQSCYGYSLGTTVALALVLLGAASYARFPATVLLVRWGWFTSLMLLLCYLAGRGVWALAACCVIYELCLARRRWLASTLLATAVAAAYGVEMMLAVIPHPATHLQPLENSFLISGPWDSWLPTALYVYFPLCLLALIAWPRRVAWRWKRPRVACASFAAVTLLGGIVLLRNMSVAETRLLLAIDLASHDAQWATVLREADQPIRPAAYAEYVNHDVNLALYHQGRLPEDMFYYPQVRLFCDHGFGARERILSRKGFDLLLELGRVNEAELIAHNDIERHPTALFLMRIARTKMVKSRPAVARLYLNVLRDDLHYGGWARACLQQLAEQPTWCEPELELVRSRMLVEDDAARTQIRLPDGSWSLSAAQSLVSLLERNPRNRMAFEYLMALHLLQQDSTAVVREFPRLRAFDYPATPRLYEEAALLQMDNQRDRPQMTAGGVLINGCLIRQESVARLLRVMTIEQMYHGLTNPAAQAALFRELGRTYFAFVFGERTPDHE